MNIQTVKEELNSYLGKKVTIKYNLGRNKFEEYDVIIKELYNRIFVVSLDNNEIKSFTYSDVIAKNIKIKF